MRQILIIFATVFATHFGSVQSQPLEIDRETVDRPGAELEYVVEGEGLPCLVIGSHTYYRRVFSNRFKKSLRCAYMNNRHFLPTASRSDNGDYDMSVVLDDVESVRRALGWQKVVVAGHSMHAHMALEYARAYPDHVSHIIMIGMTPSWPSEETQEAFWEEQASTERREAHLSKQPLITKVRDDPNLSSSEIMIKTYVLNSALYWYDPEFDCSDFWDGVEVNTELFGEYVSSSGAEYHVENGAKVRQPVLVAVGRHDYVAPYTEWKTEYDVLPNMTFVLFDRSGHTPQWEESELFDSKVEHWLAGQQ